MHFIVRSVWLKALGLSLADNLWQMALIWLLYIVVTGRATRMSASLRHTLASLGIAIGTGWFIFSLVTNLLAGTDLFAQWNWLSLSLISGVGLSNTLQSVKYFLYSILPYLSFAYLISLFFLTLRYVRYFHHTRELRSSGLQKIQPELRLFVSGISLRLGIRKPVAVWLSSIVDSPMTLGFLKPIILIPMATINHLTVQQVETILLHELAHIKRNDYLLNLFISVSGILFFFNPFSRLLIHAIKKERENCCDDLVMQFRYDPATYGSALLSLERTRHRLHGFVMGAIGKSNELLLERVRRVTGHKTPFCFDHPRLLATIFLSVMMSFVVVFQYPPRNEVNKVKSISRAGIGKQTSLDFGSTEMNINEIKAFKKERKKKTITSKGSDNLSTINQDEQESNDEAIANTEDQEVNATIPSTPRESSIVLPSSAPSPIPHAASGDFPFVPSSSFSYQIIEDTSEPKSAASSNSVKKAEKSLENALEALGEVDWNKIEPEIAQNGRQVYAQEIKTEIRKSISKLNLERINLEESVELSEADEARIKENIQLQMEAINNCILKNDTETREYLQKQIVQEKLRLQQNWLRKQSELIRKMDEIKRRNKIVYI